MRAARIAAETYRRVKHTQDLFDEATENARLASHYLNESDLGCREQVAEDLLRMLSLELQTIREKLRVGVRDVGLAIQDLGASE